VASLLKTVKSVTVIPYLHSAIAKLTFQSFKEERSRDLLTVKKLEIGKPKLGENETETNL